MSTAELHLLARVHPNLILDTAAAARLLGLPPATIRSWAHRGHIRAVPTAEPNRPTYRVTDLLHALGRNP